jgi:uncharacterized protein
MPKDIFYLHGFGSCFSPDSDKIAALSKLAPVRGANYDYAATYQNIMAHLREAATGADLIVGTSQGGFLASRLGSALGVAFVSVNPAINPRQGLRAYLGKGVDYYGKPYDLTEEATESYPDFTDSLRSDLGLMLIDEGDDVIPVAETIKAARETGMSLATFPGGDHRFQHMDHALPTISKHFYRVS